VALAVAVDRKRRWWSGGTALAATGGTGLVGPNGTAFGGPGLALAVAGGGAGRRAGRPRPADGASTAPR